jgi:hypothetical protein
MVLFNTTDDSFSYALPFSALGADDSRRLWCSIWPSDFLTGEVRF